MILHELFDGFQLDHYAVVDNQIGEVCADRLAIVKDLDLVLLIDVKPCLSQFYGQ